MTRHELIARAHRMIAEIDQLFIDTDHWNRHHPSEVPIDPDPDGEMARLRQRMVAVVNS